MIFGAIRKHLGEIFRELAEQKECQIVEGHLMPDHVHICISIPPKHLVSYVIGYIKGKSAISTKVYGVRPLLYSFYRERLSNIDLI